MGSEQSPLPSRLSTHGVFLRFPHSHLLPKTVVLPFPGTIPWRGSKEAHFEKVERAQHSPPGIFISIISSAEDVSSAKRVLGPF